MERKYASVTSPLINIKQFPILGVCVYVMKMQKNEHSVTPVRMLRSFGHTSHRTILNVIEINISDLLCAAADAFSWTREERRGEKKWGGRQEGSKLMRSEGTMSLAAWAYGWY